ncbi:MAG: dihydrofolate reductase [Gracilimonas sp.]|uniref:dihydrofolate reductase family protein n=1 Tax=Gracilimonas sp. TaxID=1974203 RepID=UPI0019CCA522|nr:dihydrofolate reductase family protein [Gracilimonas sp.]MBD3616062.1 dihydrofolate reductase [Gracilimonas sp.]
MSKVIFNISMSLDGYVADPNDDPSQLHEWYFSGDTEIPGTPFKVSKASAEMMGKAGGSVGAMVTGRRNFDLANAWGGHPPLGVHHFVVTHNPATEWEKPDSPFTFVPEGVEDAIAKAKELAETKTVCISSPSILQQALKAGLVDEIYIDLIPVLLGEGKTLFENTSQPKLECTSSVEGTGVIHLGFKVVS